MHRFLNCNKFKPEVTPARQPVLKRRERMSAVSVLLPVRTVVQAKDLTGKT